eukprot:TRINITY_DN74365_c0_g1_i1.p1 TRINITY_DN74365_c0_g1~~TRINITY_DN74365_c0_g1_i1.p1  ORF type:complete len:447 (+),score=46.33 TRINITY_DN74365_c0_g1_i1:103-1443(+)
MRGLASLLAILEAAIRPRVRAMRTYADENETSDVCTNVSDESYASSLLSFGAEFAEHARYGSYRIYALLVSSSCPSDDSTLPCSEVADCEGVGYIAGAVLRLPRCIGSYGWCRGYCGITYLGLLVLALVVTIVGSCIAYRVYFEDPGAKSRRRTTESRSRSSVDERARASVDQSAEADDEHATPEVTRVRSSVAKPHDLDARPRGSAARGSATSLTARVLPEFVRKASPRGSSEGSSELLLDADGKAELRGTWFYRIELDEGSEQHGFLVFGAESKASIYAANGSRVEREWPCDISETELTAAIPGYGNLHLTVTKDGALGTLDGDKFEMWRSASVAKDAYGYIEGSSYDLCDSISGGNVATFTFYSLGIANSVYADDWESSGDWSYTVDGHVVTGTMPSGELRKIWFTPDGTVGKFEEDGRTWELWIRDGNAMPAVLRSSALANQ